MSRFYPPYQFVPVTGKINADRDTHRFAYDEIANGASTTAPTVRHDLWHRDGLSGRLICTLRLDSPTLVGAVHGPQRGNRPVPVPQYEWRGKPALPANSLKGMISAVAEALSQSALRVLSEKRWSYLVQADPGEPPQQYGKVKKTMQITLAKHLDKIDLDLKPWTKDRNQLTPAELLFGAVQLDKEGENPDTAKNLAGRVRPRDAILIGEPRWSEEVTLRTLNSPNQPCPSMYYHLEGQRGAYLSKQDYRHNEERDLLHPNGRKFYLHHPRPAANDQTDWESHARDQHDKDRMCCRPMAAGQWFVFPIDFDNLTPAELTLLRCALEPGPGFRHRLGLGKSLGLGSVALALEGLFLIDRARRYAPKDLLEPDSRYHRVWYPQRAEDAPDWSTCYPTEWKALQGQTPYEAPEDLIDKRLVDKDTLEHLLAIGDPDRQKPELPVCTPLLDTQTDPEVRTYEWFDTNDQSINGHQALPAINPDERLLPWLYGDMAQARQSGRFQDADFDAPPVLPALLQKVVDALPPFQGAITQDGILVSKPLAEGIQELEKTNRSHAKKVFDALNKVCETYPQREKNGITFKTKAENIYRKLKFLCWYQNQP